MAQGNAQGLLTVAAHAVVAVGALTSATILATAHAIPGSDALIVILGVAGITGPNLGRPQWSPPDPPPPAP